MKTLLALLSLSALSLHADLVTISEKNDTPQVSLPPAASKENFSSYMMIDPKLRALDYQQAFEQLRKQKTTAKVYFQLANGDMISNIIDMSLMPNSTLILFRSNSQQGIQLQLVKIEEIAGLHYY
jgi:hypothetical protein